MAVAAPSAAQPLQEGTTDLGDGAFAYRPSGLGDAPTPLIVILRGALGSAKGFLSTMRPIADRHRAVMLAPEPASSTWRVKRTAERAAELGPDATRIDAAIATVAGRMKLDRDRIILLGFSDGASYGLSLGTAKPELFRSIVALSPGYTSVPRSADPQQRIFIAHGKSDRILAPANVRNFILPDLQAAGLKPRMRWFNGGHTIDRAALAEAMTYALGAP